MIEVVKINDNLKLEIIKEGCEKTLNFYRKSINIESLSFTLGSSLYRDFKYDSNYFIIYSKYFNRPASANIEFLYDINNDKKIYLDEYISLDLIIKYMFIYTRDFDIETVLSVINKNNLKMATNEKIENMINYLRSNNENITRDEVVNYILKQYSGLSRYTNLPENISVIEYKKLMEEFYYKKLSFHRMPQTLDLEALKSKDKILAKKLKA